MSKILDFKCTYDNSIGINKEVTEKTNLKFPEAYKNWESMVILSKELKNYDNAMFCELPFCHTVEGEAMGGDINFGDENIGPRTKDYICRTGKEILELPKIDFSKGRISQVLKACKCLREQDENVVLNVSGPFTIMNVLIEPRHTYKIFRKKPELMKDIFDKLQEEIFRFIYEAEKVGVNMISYADSSAGVNILGPKLSKRVVEMFTYPLLKKVEGKLNEERIILLCPKTTFALLGTNKAKWRDIQLKSPMKYSQACVEAIGKAKFVGQTCIKNTEFELKNGIIKAVELF